MKKIIILGSRGSGKTTKAFEIVKGKKTVFLKNSDLDDRVIYNKINKETEFIVIDEISDCSHNRFYLKRILTTLTIFSQKNYKKTEEINMPNIIVISSEIEADFFKNIKDVEIIQL